MDRHKKLFLFVSALVLMVLAGSFTIWAQPFSMSSPQPQQPAQYQALSSGTGRFVFGQISKSYKDKFMLDTATGRLWRIAESGRIGLYLESVTYRIARGDYRNMPGESSDSEKKEAEKE